MSISFPFATAADLSARAGVEVDNVPQAESILLMASAVVAAYIGQDFDDGAVPLAASQVTINVAYRVWVNPDGLVGDTIDDASRRWSERTSSEGFYLTAADKMILDGLRKPAANRGLWSLGVTRGSGVDGTVYVPTGPAQSGYPFPWYSSDDPAL